MDSANTSTTTTTAEATGPIEVFLTPTPSTNGAKTVGTMTFGVKTLGVKIWTMNSEDAPDSNEIKRRLGKVELDVDHFIKNSEKAAALHGARSDPYDTLGDLLKEYLDGRMRGSIVGSHNDANSLFMKSPGDTKLTLLMPSSKRKAGNLTDWEFAVAVNDDYRRGKVDEYGNFKSFPTSGTGDSDAATQQASGTGLSRTLDSALFLFE